ncbi:hypothetical protein [Roseomonas sp. WA12]
MLPAENGSAPVIVAGLPARNAHASHYQRDRGLIVAALGRGHGGKTYLGRLLVEFALREGKAVFPADGDIINQGLSRYPGLGDAMKPEDDTPEAVATWLEEVVDYATTHRVSVYMDFAGGDQSVDSRADAITQRVSGPAIGEDVWGLHAIAELSSRVDMTMLYFLAGYSDDERGLERLNATSLSSLPLVIVANEGLAPKLRGKADPFAENLASQPVVAAIKRGAIVLRLPALSPNTARFVEEGRMGFFEAVAAKPGKVGKVLPLWDRQELARYLRKVASQLEPIKGLLP